MSQPKQPSHLHQLAPPRAAAKAPVYPHKGWVYPLEDWGHLLARRALAATFPQPASKEVSA
jgi:cytochrome c peroxidase